jgi:hypothetical protein
MIFVKIKIKIQFLVWCDDPPEDRVISIFAGCLANHDRAHSLTLLGGLKDIKIEARLIDERSASVMGECVIVTLKVCRLYSM